MPTYHFIREDNGIVAQGELPLVRVTSEHLSSGVFDTAQYVLDGIARFVVKDCLGSLILVDKTREDLNKLHIGRLFIRHPHIEFYKSGGKEGPRVDLHEVDIVYAEKRLEELTLLRSPEQRQVALLRYTKPPICNWYSTPHRIKQLQISSCGLETKISEMQETIEKLQLQEKNAFVSDTVKKLEERGYALIENICRRVRDLPKIKTKKGSPKLVCDSGIVLDVADMYHHLNEIFDFIVHRVNLEDARKYWEKVDAWGDL